METIASEYIVCIIEAAMTMFFCIYVVKDRLTVRRTALLPLAVATLALIGSALSMAISAGLDTWLPYELDTSTPMLLLWFLTGFFCLRAATHEPKSALVFLLILASQVLQLCRSVTFFFYGLVFPELAVGDFAWTDIVGFGVPSVLLTLLLAVFCRSLYQKLQGQGWNEYARLWMIPLFFVILYTLQINLLPIEGSPAAAYSIKILLLLCAFLTYSQMASAIRSAAKAARESAVHAQLAHQLDLQRARMEDLESHAEEMKRIRHDRRQHVQVLRGLLEKNEIQEALTYLDDYEGSMAQAIQPPLCENYVADTLCRRYEALAKQSGIEVTTELTLPKEPGIAGSDLAVILGNLWENAVTAALDAEEGRRFIQLKVQTEAGRVLIRMENGFSGPVYEENERFYSTKPGRNRAEGVGIASIRAVAERCGGIAGFTYTPDTFTASVLLYRKQG
ncbi:sensor histidine kinase [Qiania dongpingensis]|uniref:GHKL domain-containing protein n=1 Tax=Qiania dongpingensis TaxID=2763669 RepID=A0A7G9G2V9_9FIRM|nr:GHKL domain-containing protein [Qiania dongpingensis]QNM05141.1 GHKL domain-containing protein [Qiania dongpingensis]